MPIYILNRTNAGKKSDAPSISELTSLMMNNLFEICRGTHLPFSLDNVAPMNSRGKMEFSVRKIDVLLKTLALCQRNEQTNARICRPSLSQTFKTRITS